MKARCYIVSIPLPRDQERRASAHAAFRQFSARVSGVRQSYFACYGNAESGFVAKINAKLSGRAATPERALARAARAVCRATGVDPDLSKVERRGDMDSPLHSLMMRVALHPNSRDPQQLMDAVHWCINAAGYSYLDELIMAAGHSAAMARSIHPDPKEAPKVG